MTKEKAQESYKISSSDIGATFIQYGINAGQERVASNVKSLIESNSLHKINSKTILSGFLSNVGYHYVSMLPAAKILNKVKDKDFDFLNVIAPTIVETLFGVPLEVKGFQKVLSEMGVEIAGKLTRISYKVAPAYFVRNAGFWSAMNNEIEDSNLLEQGVKIFAKGFISSFPDSVGNFVMKYNPSLSVGESYLAALKETVKMSPQTILKAGAVRGLSVLAGSFILHDKFNDKIKDCFSQLDKDSNASQPNKQNSKGR